ncbi:NB-ARC domain-containing protein [Amycolatopsis sp. lyj-346]|uniref:WD40 domain-containing protein n=1 Tax=Amycolatopsis sp. lyj-346 TaxID=2789289 RepID=UPI00397D7D38
MADDAPATLAKSLRQLMQDSGCTFTQIEKFAAKPNPDVKFSRGTISGWLDPGDPKVPEKWDTLELLVKYLLAHVPADRRRGEIYDSGWLRSRYEAAKKERAREGRGGRPRSRKPRPARPKPKASTAGAAQDDVPPQPPGYVSRGELRRIVASIVSDDPETPDPDGHARPVGLHGPGGTGKSVLAAAATRDEEVRCRFPGGVSWIPLGEGADLLAAQLRLLRRLGSSGAAPRTTKEATARLRRMLARRQVLLVVDDVWSAADAEALGVTGAGSRVLYTCRDPAVLTTVGPLLHRVGDLSLPTAKQLVAAVAGVDVRELPGIVDRVCVQLGGVALAIALVAAAARDGMPWERIADDLENGSREYDEHPAANAFKAMQVATGRLPAPARHTLLSLAVFPADTRVPIEVVCRFWAHLFGKDDAGCRRELARLAGANLLQLDGGADVIAFHDLQHDYLALHVAPPIADLHVHLLDAYEPSPPPTGSPRWWRLPADEPYLGDHLVHHLRGAGDGITLAATVTDPAYLVSRIAAAGPHRAEADLATAADVLGTDPAVAWWQGWIRRHAHWLDPQGPEDGHGVVATACAWLAADPGRLGHGIDAERLAPLLPGRYLRVRWGLNSPGTALTRVLRGPAGPVRDVAWSPDGALIAAAGDDGAVRVWEPLSGRLLLTLHGGTEGVEKLGWSPGGTFLAAGSRDGVLRVWDTTERQEVAVLTGHTGPVGALAWSPDGRRLASAGEDGTARIWEPGTGRSSAVLPLFNRRLRADSWNWRRQVAWSPDGRRLAVTTSGRTAVIWDPATGGTRPLTATFGMQTIAWSPDGRRVAASNDAKSRVFDAADGKLLMTLAAAGKPGVVNSTVWSPDGTRLATGGDDGSVRLWDATTGKMIASQAHRAWCHDLAWSPDGRWLAYVYSDEAGVWEVAGTTTAPLGGHTGSINAVAWSPDGSLLATAGRDGTARVWDPGAGRDGVPPTGETGVGYRTVAWSADHSRLATTGYDGQVRIWHADGRHEATVKPPRGRPVYAIAWHPALNLLATVGVDGAVRISDADTGSTVRTLRRGFTNAMKYGAAIAWSPDGRSVAAACGEKAFLLSAVGQSRLGRRGRSLTRRPHEQDWVTALAWSPDGTLVAVNRRSAVTIWDGTTNQVAVTLTEDRFYDSPMAWSPDGKSLAVATEEGTVRFWTAGARQAGRGPGHAGRINKIAWSPDSRSLASAGADGTARTWDGPAGVSSVRYETDGTAAVTVSWSPDGTLLAIGEDDGRITVCDPARGTPATRIALEPHTDLSWTSGGLAIVTAFGPAVLEVVN